MSNWIARRCLVTGRVQGVFYRASTREQALARGVTGYARNLPDGSVEVLACGDPSAVAELCAWLWEGPPMAEVVRVEIEKLADSALPDRPTGFSTS
jgi:acylphosphatase